MMIWIPAILRCEFRLCGAADFRGVPVHISQLTILRETG
jgi:hypothetical protein